MPIPRLTQPGVAVLVVDMQAKLLPKMKQSERIAARTGILLDGCRALGVPILATEQYKKGLGDTVPGIAERLTDALCVEEKLKFSACIEPVRQALTEAQARSVLVCGIETHVCVLQTCLDLAEAGYVTFIAADACSSRAKVDHEWALRRLIQAGIVPTTVESALLELVHEAGTDAFRKILELIR